MLITTTSSITGHIIKKTLGLVIVVREYKISRPRKAVYEAINALITQAKARGADAIAGLRINTSPGDQVMAVIAYGTAVELEKKKSE